MATKTVTVKKGDTLGAIAKANNTTVSAIAKASGISNVNKISVGQKISLPTSTTAPKSTSSTSSSKSPTTVNKSYANPINTISSSSKSNNMTYADPAKNPIKPTVYKPIVNTTSTPEKKNTVLDSLSNFFSNTSNKINSIGSNLGKYNTASAASYLPPIDTFTDVPFTDKPKQSTIEKNSSTPNDILLRPEANKSVVNSFDDSSSFNSTSAETGLPEKVGTNIPMVTSNGTDEVQDTGTITETTKQILDDGTEKTVVNTSTPVTPTTPMISNYSDIVSKLGALNTGLKNTLADNTTWMSSGSKGEFQNTQIVNYTSNAANLFNTADDAAKFYSTPEGKATLPQGVNANDIISKVTVLKNGVTEPKTTAEFLAYDKNMAKKETDLYNEQIANEFNWTQQQKDTLLGKKDKDGNIIALGVAEALKKENDAYIDYYEEKIQNEQTSQREKAQLMIDKAEAEFKSKDAETEINRQNAKASLTEFLAKIGALRTDGNALLGIEKLEQAYQAQRQSLKSTFDLSKREIQMNMNDNINKLESDLDDKKFKLSQDLSKTEREVAADVAKLEYEYKKDVSTLKFKYNDAIQTAKEKAQTKAEKASSDWTNAYLTVSGADMFKSLPAEFRNQWLSNNPINAQGFKTTQEDLAKDYANWSKNQNTGVTLTPAKKTAAISWLTNNSAPSWVIEGVKNGDENAILTTMRLMEENQ